MLKSVSNAITAVMAVTTLDVVAVPTPAAPPFTFRPRKQAIPPISKPKRKLFSRPGHDVADEQRVEHEIDEIDQRDVEIGARDQARRHDRRQARDDGETGHQREEREHARRDQETQRTDAHRLDGFHFLRDLHRPELGGKRGADSRREHDPGQQRAELARERDCDQARHEPLGAEALELITGQQRHRQPEEK